MSKKILIADAPSQCIQNYTLFLARQGYEVITATTLDRAEDLIGGEDFSVVFIGHDLLGDLASPRLRKMKKNRQNCKFVLLTGSIDVETFITALNGIFHECLVNPLSLVVLRDVIHDLIHLEKEKNETPLTRNAMYV